MSFLCAYEVYQDKFGNLNFLELNPTGKWKMVTKENNSIYIEHKIFWVFTRWVHENRITFKSCLQND